MSAEDAFLEDMAQIAEFIQLYHSEQIDELIAGDYDEPTLDISLRELSHYAPDLYSDLVNEPDKRIPWFQEAVRNFEELCENVNHQTSGYQVKPIPHPIPRGKAEDMEEFIEESTPDDAVDGAETLVSQPAPGQQADEEVAVTFVDPPPTLIRDIGEPRGQLFDQIVAFEGICQQTSDPKPRILEATFQCQKCGDTQHVDTSDTFDMENAAPGNCTNCDRGGPWERLKGDDVRKEYQQVRVQEPPEEARNSSNPRDIVCDSLGREHVDVAEPGDRITVVGIIREDADSDSTLQDNRFEVLSIIPEETQFDEIEVTDEDLKKIEELASQPDLYDTLTQSIAPSIHGYEAAKRGIAMQMFGGVTTEYYGNRERGQIHVMLIGDPGTGKTNLLEYARSIAPRAVSSSGTASTSVGLTASAQKEKIGNEEQWTLQAGSLVLADESVISIDEFDKFAEEQQRSVNQALSEGEIDVDKANVHATLKARCSALLAANPRDGRFDPYESYASQFDMPQDLLSRCDLIFTFRDEPDEEQDAAVAEKILEPHTGDDRATADGGELAAVDQNGVVNPELFQKYVAHARREYDPQLTEDAREYLHGFYTTCREALSSDSTIGLNGRQLGAVRRLTQAFARASLSDTATKEHAEEAAALLQSSLEQAVSDPDGDGFDIDRLEFGSGPVSQQKRMDLAREIVQELEDDESGAAVSKVLGRLGSEGIGQELAERTIEKLQQSGVVYEHQDGHLRMV